MVCLRNQSIKEILLRKEELVIYGASRNLENVLRTFGTETIQSRVRCIVDRSEEKNGTEFLVCGCSFPVCSIGSFLKEKDIAFRFQMLIVIEDYKTVLECLDGIPELDGMSCNIWWPPFLSVHSGKTMTKKLVFPSPGRKYTLPKVIHYCWFGGSALPSEAKECIQSWKETCPDFEIQEWNEQNFDVNALPYVREAYRAGKFSFVSDYVRYDVISRYGGFYFDTDVKLLRGIDDLCQYRGFFSFEYFNLINSGSGFGAQAGDAVILELRDNYHSRRFVNGQELKPCSKYETEYFREKGVWIDDYFQIFEDFLIFPHEFFSPVNQVSAVLELTENTRGIHGFDCAWLQEELLEAWHEKKNNIKSINERLMQTWKEDIRKSIQ